MSYAEKIGDKFYWMNPPDAQDGDEIFIAQKWRDWQEFCDDPLTYSIHKVRERRRLIDPGVGWRIVKAQENIPSGSEATLDGVIWKPIGMKGVWTPLQLATADMLTAALGGSVVAIRQRIPVEAGKNLESSLQNEPISTGSGPVPVESNTGQASLAEKVVNELVALITPNSIRDKCHLKECMLEWVRPLTRTGDTMLPSDPRIQRVIDAAREYVKELTKDGAKFGSNQGMALESALAALGEPTKDDEWPRYWATESVIYRKLSPNQKQQSKFLFIKDEWQDSVTESVTSLMKRLTPAEAQARMEGNDTKPDAALLKAFKESGLRSTAASTHNDRFLVFSAGWNAATKPPAQDELRELLERVEQMADAYAKQAKQYQLFSVNSEVFFARSNQCLEIQRWIEEAMQKRNEVPQKVEGDNFEEWRRQYEKSIGHSLYSNDGFAVQDYIKWHAAKGKENKP